jgi:hypothetical protein
MTTNTRRAALLLFALILAACGGEDAATTTAAGEPPATTQTTAPVTTTSEAATTTTEAPTTTQAVATSDCLVGSWELDSESFIQQVFAGTDTGFEELGEVTVSHGGGSFVVEMSEDGTYIGTRDEWKIRIESEEGAFVNMLDGTETGTWSVDGDTLTISSDVSDITVSFAAEVDGVLQELPFGGTQTTQTRAFTGSGGFSCSDDSFEATFDGFTSVFSRS